MVAFAAMSLFLAGPGLCPLVPARRAGFFANVGATAQAQAELSIYRWPKWGIQDEVRRSRAADLSKAIRAYHLALEVDPQNVTANRRLGQIELSRGDYSAARRHLELASTVAPQQRATRQLLGEVNAIEGNFEKALNQWESIDTSNGQLDARRWWYQHIGAEQEVKRITEVLALLRKKSVHLAAAQVAREL